MSAKKYVFLKLTEDKELQLRTLVKDIRFLEQEFWFEDTFLESTSFTTDNFTEEDIPWASYGIQAYSDDEHASDPSRETSDSDEDQ